jgi:hypothetical protein
MDAAGQLARDRASPRRPSPRASPASTARLSGCTDDDLTNWLTKDLAG